MNLIRKTWAISARRPLFVVLSFLSLNAVLLLLLNLSSIGLVAIPVFGVLCLSLFVPWMVLFEKRRGISLYLNTLLSVALVLYYTVHALLAIGLDDQLSGFRFTLISIQLYLNIIAIFVAKGMFASKKLGAELGIVGETEYVKALPSRPKRIGARAFSWVDALLDAAIMVVLINIFIFQLYVVPSESMVPTILQNDRPFVLKITEGPKLPVTNFGLPRIRQAQAGDISVVQNPAYDHGPAAEARKLGSDIVYMLTFTAVNLNQFTPEGEIRYDPLVKRLIGVPGDTLEMVGQRLYRYDIAAGGSDSQPYDDGRYSYFADLHTLPASTREKIQTIIPGSQLAGIYSTIDREIYLGSQEAYATAWDSATAELAQLSRTLQRVSGSLSTQGMREADLAAARILAMRIRGAAETPGAITPARDFSLGGSWVPRQSLEFAIALLLDPAANKYFQDFLVSAQKYQGWSKYYRGASLLNLSIKKELAHRVLAVYRSMGAEVDVPELSTILPRLEALFSYTGQLSQRAFAPFPGPNQAIPEGQYFLMGDNRLNSTDLRHQGSGSLQPLDASDPESVLVRSNVDPRTVPTSALGGLALFKIYQELSGFY